MTTSEPSAFNEIMAREQGLHRNLSGGQLSMIAIGGAIGTGLFLGSGFAIGFAGPAVLLSYLIGAVITLLVMGCMAEMTVAHPTSGSFGAWAEFYLSPVVGYLVRFAYWAGVVFALGTEITAIAVYMRFWFPSFPGWAWICGFSILLVLVNSFNVHLFGTVEYGFSALKIAAIVAFLLLGGYVMVSSSRFELADPVGFRNYVAYGGFFPKGLRGMWIGVLVSLFSYFSIEMIAVAAGEAKDPERAIRGAFRATMVRLVLFYVLTLALVLAIVPWPITAAGVYQSPFVTVMTRTHIPHAAGVVNFIILIAALSAMNSQLYITARMLFSLSRAGLAPRRLGSLSRRGVPIAALLFSSAGIALAAILNIRYHDRSFLLMVAISMFGPMFTWTMIFITHLSFRRHQANRQLRFRMWGYPYTSLLGAALMIAALITTVFVPAFQPTLLYGIPFLVVMTLIYLVRPHPLSATRRLSLEARVDN